MEYILDILSREVSEAFEKAGYPKEAGRVVVSNRPDLCDFQCNGAMSLAKSAHKAPLAIAEGAAEHLKGSRLFSAAEAVKPGFLNFKLSSSFLKDYLDQMMKNDLGRIEAERKLKIIMDYGGPNVAKPLHIGHLRSAIIGEAIKRMARYLGHEVIADIHLGDWGLQMGLIIHELSLRKPELCYFDEDYKGEYPKEPPFTLEELEEIYPAASKRSKEDENYKAAAMEATFKLQRGVPGFTALWNHIMAISVADLKKNYARLDVSFDLWKGESDADRFIPDMIERLKKEGYAKESQGALVVDVSREDDKKEIPPCIILKSDGASLYTTTDLATLVDRQASYQPDRIIYVVDKRQGMHFEQVFRCAKKTGIVHESTVLDFLGFGTMNGADGGPFKTRDGGVMRLESLLAEVYEEMLKKMKESDHELMGEEAEKTALIVSDAAIKYGDLSNQATKDYIFDIDKFTSFEGNTGPYILYTVVRIKSILRKYKAEGGTLEGLSLYEPETEEEKALMLLLTGFNRVTNAAFEELAPHRICSFLYETANEFNRFYHSTRILSEEDEVKKKGYIALLCLTEDILEKSLGLLGMKAPEKM